MSKWRKIEDLLIYSGKGITPKYVEESSIIVLNQKCIRNHKIDYTFSRFTNDTKKINPDKFIMKGDILFNSTGQGTAGRCAFVDWLPEDKRVITDSHILVIRIPNYFEAQCLSYSFHSIEKDIMSFMDGSTGQGELDKIRVFNLLTSLSENPKTQKQIAKVLSDLDAKIEVNNKINQQLEAMAKTLYDYWFVQFDFPSPSSSSGQAGKPYKSSGGKMVFNEALKREIPEGWEVQEINEIIKVKDGTHDSPKSVDKGFKLITSKHLKLEGLDFDTANSIGKEDYLNVNKRSKVDTGDILFSMIGSIGTVYKVEEKNIDFAIKNVALYKSSENLKLKNYIYMYLKGYDMQKYMGNVIAGSIQKFIGLGSLRKMPLMIDEETINNYEKKTKSTFDQINNLKLENQKLSELRDWLLPMLMNGQVTVGEE